MDLGSHIQGQSSGLSVLLELDSEALSYILEFLGTFYTLSTKL